MKKREKWTNAGLTLLVVALFFANVEVASAHNWWLWCWHKGSTLGVWVFGTNTAESNAALTDWDSHSDVNFSRKTSHTDLSVFGGNFGATGWWGLASVEGYSYDWWHHWWFCRLDHCHARFNTFYGGSSGDVRGVLCQEIGHCLGLQHSNDGCMGKGYFNNLNTTVPHNWSDINSKF